MPKKAIIVFSFFLLVLLGLSACTSTCDPSSLQAPDLVSPDWREVVDGSAATLEWSYPDTCQPEQYEIILSQQRDFSVIEHDQLVAGETTTWTPPVLDIAEEYFWRVRAKVGSSYGAWSHELRSFFTLPYCDAGDLVAPALLLPEWGAIFDRAYDSLEWEWPLSSCIPESYRVEVSMGSPSFTDTTYNGATGSPGTRWGFGSTPPAATQFWWRITPYSDGTYGPTSMAGMFFTDPVCSAASLVQPVGVMPAEGEIVASGNPIFSWTYPDPSCSPEGFHVLVSYSPDMSHMALEANNPTIGARSFQAGIPIPDCTEYYWWASVVSEGVDSPPSEIHRFVIDTSGTCDCDTASLPDPVITGPDPFEVLPDTDAHLSWYRRGGCIPDGAAVNYYDAENSYDELIPGPFVAGYDPPALEPATQYWWKAAYYVDDGGPVLGDYSSWRSFFTGPECSSIADLAAPELLAPEDGAVVDTLTPILRFNPGETECIPDSYDINLQEDPAFGGTSLMGDMHVPGTAFSPNPLDNCTWYYWKVAGIQDGSYGPESEARSFYVNVDGTCLPPGIPARAIKNNFCRLGTYPEYFDAVWTFETGDQALAVARNPFTTYLQLMVLDEKTGQPLEPMILCWSLLNAFEPVLNPPEGQDEEEDDFRHLPVVNPPPTPVPTLVPVLVCHEKLSPEECLAAGGKPDPKTQYCNCPK